MHIEATATIEGDYGSVSDFRACHPQAVIQYIDDKAVMVFCEHCGEPLFEDDKYQTDLDGVSLCQECYDTMVEGDNDAAESGIEAENARQNTALKNYQAANKHLVKEVADLSRSLAKLATEQGMGPMPQEVAK